MRAVWAIFAKDLLTELRLRQMLPRCSSSRWSW